MAITSNEFLQSATDIGLVSAGATSAFIAERGIDLETITLKELALALVDAGLMTKFQAEVIAAGKPKALVIGDYVVTEKIGQGGMGQVFKALHTRMKRTVAIKMLPRGKVDSESMVRRFYREVEAAGKLNHPNIVTAFDAGEHHGTHYLVMEMVEGMDLAAVLRERGKLGLEQAVNVVLQTAAGLLYAHKHGVIHRDIKPGNLLVDREGNIKILDMGLARMDDEGGGPAEQSLTMAGRLMGTVEYMAPEQAANARNADLRADIYALGCTFYRLVTGNLPYKGESPMETVIAHREQPIPSLGDKTVIPKAVQLIFAGMVAKKAGDRYGSMQTLIEDLMAVMPEATRCPVRLDPREHSTFTINQPGSSTMQKLGAGSASSSASKAIPTAIPVAQPATHAKKPAEPAWWKSQAVLGGAGVAALLTVVVTIALIKRGGDAPAKAVATAAPAKPQTPNRSLPPTPAPPRPAAKYKSGPKDPAVREALTWVLSKGGRVREWKGNASYGPDTDSVDHVTDAVLEKLGIDLANKPITDDDIARLVPLATLRSLNVSRTKIGNAAMASIGNLRNLERLSLAGTQVTNAGVNDLTGLRELGFLQLNDTHITGNALEFVAKLPVLKTLEVKGTAVKAADVERFKRDAPRCVVLWNSGVTAVAAVAPVASTPPRPTLPPRPGGVDLMADADPDAPLTGPKWARQGTGLRYNDTHPSLFGVTPRVSGDYEVELRFITDGPAVDVGVILPILDHHVTLLVKGTTKSPVVGLQDLDNHGVGYPSDVVHPSASLEPGHEYTLDAAVHVVDGEASIRARLDGEQMIAWHGDPQRLTISSYWKAQLRRGQIAFGGRTDRNRLTITAAHLWPPVTPPAIAAAPDARPVAAPPRAPEPATPPPPAAVDLLPTFDFKADTLRGTWTKKDDALYNDGKTVGAQLMAPVNVTGDYDLELEFTRTGGPDGLALVLPIGDAATALLVGGSGNRRLALADVKGANATRSSDSNKSFSLENGHKYKLLVRTRLTEGNAHIEVLVDDNPVIDWTGSRADLKVNKSWAQPAGKPPRLALGSNRSEITFHTARLRPAGGAVTPLNTN